MRWVDSSRLTWSPIVGFIEFPPSPAGAANPVAGCCKRFHIWFTYFTTGATRLAGTNDAAIS